MVRQVLVSLTATANHSTTLQIFSLYNLSYPATRVSCFHRFISSLARGIQAQEMHRQ